MAKVEARRAELISCCRQTRHVWRDKGRDKASRCLSQVPNGSVYALAIAPVAAVLLVRSTSDIDNFKTLLDEATFYDKQASGPA